MQPAAERRERLAAAKPGEAPDTLDAVRPEGRVEIQCPRPVVEQPVEVLVRLGQQAHAHAGQLCEVVEVDARRRVVLRVVVGPVVLVRERRDVHPRDARGEERPDLGPGGRRVERPPVREQAVALCFPEDTPAPAGDSRRRVDRERVARPGALDVEVEGHAGSPLRVLDRNLIPGAVAPVVAGFREPVFLGRMRAEGQRVARARAGLGVCPGNGERGGDAGRVVERTAEPAVVMARHHERRASSPARQDSDHVSGLRSAGQGGLEHDPHPLPLVLAKHPRVVLADRHRRRRAAVPDPVEGPERAGRLVVRPVLARRHDEAERAAQPRLEGDVVRPQPLLDPLDEHDLAGDVESVELPPARAACEDQLRLDPVRPGLGDAPERRAFEALAAGLDIRVHESPRVDRHRLLDDVREPQRPQLTREERGRLALLRRARHAEPEGVRAEALEPLDDASQVVPIDRRLEPARLAHRTILRRLARNSAIHASPRSPSQSGVSST